VFFSKTPRRVCPVQDRRLTINFSPDRGVPLSPPAFFSRTGVYFRRPKDFFLLLRTLAVTRKCRSSMNCPLGHESGPYLQYLRTKTEAPNGLSIPIPGFFPDARTLLPPPPSPPIGDPFPPPLTPPHLPRVVCVES